MTEVVESPVFNPADIERKINECANRIADGVQIVTKREREAREKRREFDRAYALAYVQSEAPAHVRKYEADLATMDQRKAAEDAEVTFKHAERQAKALEKELVAWQSVGASVRTMFGAVRA